MVAITVLNGALPTSVLTSIGSGFTLRHDAAASYLRARADGCPAGITTAYRTGAEQQRLLNLYGYPRAEYVGRSQHGEGVALDIPEPARSWFAARGTAYGWVRTVSFEAWHFEYQPARDTHAHAPAQEDDMPTAQEVAQAVWTMALGPTGATPAGPAWVHLVAAREAAAAAAAAVGPLETTNPHLGPAPLAVFVGDTRVDAMRLLDAVAGLAAKVAALGNGSGGPTPVIDYAALAKAVNDDAARRLAS